MNHRPSAVDLAGALDGLPALAPPGDAWRSIERRLAAERRRNGLLGASAALAVLALLAADLSLRSHDVPPPVTATAPEVGVEPSLERRSRQLESLLEALPPARVSRASTRLTTALLEDRIALIDERLGGQDSPAQPAAIRTALKRERLLLLDSLVRVRYATAAASL